MVSGTVTAGVCAGARETSLGASIPIDSIADAGTYICNWSGHLLRVRGGAPGATCRPLFNMVGPEPLFVTKISENPDEPVNRARRLATQLAPRANF